MSPEQHNKYLAYSHLGFAGLYLLLMIFIMAVFGLAFFGPQAPNGPPLGIMLIVWLFITLFYGAMTVPSFLAGYALLKRKRWAKTATIVAAVLAAMQFPVGTAVCVYSFWFMFSEPGRLMFDRPAYILPPGTRSWAKELPRAKEVQYAPPPTPPDWR